MEPDYMETLAKAYNEQLKSSLRDSTLSDALELCETQLNLIEFCLLNYPQANNAAAYLKSLKQITQRELIGLGAGNSIPTASYSRCERISNPYNRLINAQLELFSLLDKLEREYPALSLTLLREQRALGLMGVIR